MALFGVVNVDIVNSRNIGNRQELQERLKHLIKELNQKYAGVLVSPIAITLGDECQAVLANPSQSYNLVDAFQQCLWQYNIDIYAGVGIGEISTAVNEDVRMMDGPCFHAAREAINAAKLFPKNKGSMATSKNNKVFFKEEEKVPLSSSLLAYAQESIRETAASLEFGTFQKPGEVYSLGYIINTIIENNEILKSRLTSKQKQAYLDYETYGSYRKMLEANAGKRKGSIGSISQRLNNAEYFTICRNRETIEYLLGLYTILRGLVT